MEEVITIGRFCDIIGQLYFDTLLRYVLSVTFRGAVVMKVLAQKTRGHKYHNALYLSPRNFA